MRSTDHRTDGRRKRRAFGLKGMFVLAALGLAVATEGGLAVSEATDLFVSDRGFGSVLEYNGTTGAFVREFVPRGGLSGANGVVFGPNGDLFVSSGANTSNVLEYNGTTGAFVRTFVPTNSGGLSSPTGLVFGPNGDLFVSANTGQVLEYNGTTGAFVRTFDPTNSGGLEEPGGLVFGPTAATPSVPEPSTWLLLGSGLAGLAVWRRKKAA